MNETHGLVEAFDNAIANGERCALATIVRVDGSSYRRPGARMLILETGETTGTISAGCLESDVIEHAKRVIGAGETKVVEYDNGSTTDEMAWGLGLGCNGVVSVLIEPLNSASLYIDALRKTSALQPDTPVIVAATVYASASKDIAPGSRVFIHDGADPVGEKLNGAASAVADQVRAAIGSITTYGDHVIEIAGSEVKLFVERLIPPVPLVIFGAGHDALPIVELARSIGWQTEVVDLQERGATTERFSIADRVTLARPENIPVTITPRTMAIVMSHNYSHDMDALRFLLASPARYIGVMGPRKRTERMLSEMGATPDAEVLPRLHSPVGLDIGANGPTEIALSIIGEMRAVLEGKSGGMLRDSRGPIQKSAETEGRPNDKKGVAAIILAAGSSSRMGKPKQTLQFKNTSLLKRSVRSALEAGCSPVIVVTGANAELSREELKGLGVSEVWNRDWELGMGSSIAAGIGKLLDADPAVNGAVIMLCDQPHVTADVISRLISAHRLTRKSIIASHYGSGYGVPALFKRSRFEELTRLEGTAGAKAIIARYGSHVHYVPFPEGEVDIDTQEDYQRLISSDPGAGDRQTL